MVGYLCESSRSSSPREVAIVLFNARLLPTHSFARHRSRFPREALPGLWQTLIYLGANSSPSWPLQSTLRAGCLETWLRAPRDRQSHDRRAAGTAQEHHAGRAGKAVERTGFPGLDRVPHRPNGATELMARDSQFKGQTAFYSNRETMSVIVAHGATSISAEFFDQTGAHGR